MLFHKQIMINAKINDAVRTPEQAIDFLKDLVQKIDMKIIQGPYASYVDAEGNRGVTAIVMIETSHIAFHVWDEKQPGTVQFDLYTCGALDKQKVLDAFGEEFDVVSMDYRMYNREVGFVLEEEGSL
jgi:S-adenosylmethionine/arginine decarboxylase-like enzyme